MRYRQVHLDFHTSEAIPNIGSRFRKKQFQMMLERGHVDSITVFSKCHHGWSYHPTLANTIHPNLAFDLLGAQIQAAHEMDVRTPVYVSAGFDEKQARERPDWLVRDVRGRTTWVDSFLKPGFHKFCMNTPYLDVVVAQIEEVVLSFDADGIFLDIVGVQPCLCGYCIASLLADSKDPTEPGDVLELAERTYASYARRANEAVHRHKPGLSIFHNAGHITRGRRDLASFNSHLELESLPTGGWGYDHFPLSARYVGNLGMDYLGMTGKFHTFWGEFGGYKHPNALRYEAALNLANGARMSVGDQLHPEGEMDEATYSLIGTAYAELEKKQPWCEDARNVADVALLSVEAAGTPSTDVNEDHRFNRTDAGAVRMLLEGKFLFDVIDLAEDLSGYKVLILPDSISVDRTLEGRLGRFFAGGGRILASGKSGLNPAGDAFAIDLGVHYDSENPFNPTYFRPHWPLANMGEASFVFYSPGQKVTLAGGTVLGDREDPYFNREFDHFCSHMHAPSTLANAGPGMVESSNGIYIAWNVFDDYATKGSLALRESVVFALNRLLGEQKSVETNLAAQGIVTLTVQAAHNRYIAHLLYASPVKRGDCIEVIEDLLPLHDTEVTLRLPAAVKKTELVPQNEQIPFTQSGTSVTFTVPRFTCHQMISIDF